MLVLVVVLVLEKGAFSLINYELPEFDCQSDGASSQNAKARTRTIFVRAPSFEHVYRPPTVAVPYTLFLLHGTGGDEHDMVPLAEAVLPGAGIISPRGQVIENGAPRFFRRFAEGVLDVEDWRERSEALADFLASICAQHKISPKTLLAVGYSNGANIAQGLLLLRPEVLGGAILLRPMFITDDIPANDLGGRPILLLGGSHDPIIPADDLMQIAQQLGKRGAQVTAETVQASHGLTETDIVLARQWLANSVPARTS